MILSGGSSFFTYGPSKGAIVNMTKNTCGGWVPSGSTAGCGSNMGVSYGGGCGSAISQNSKKWPLKKPSSSC